MSKKLRVDYEAVKSLCARLGVEHQTDAQNQGLRDEVIYCLSQNIAALECLAERGGITLSDLGRNKLLIPERFRNLAAGYFGPESVKDGYQATYSCYWTKFEEFGEAEIHQLAKCRDIGKRSMDIVSILIDLHSQTGGFKTLLGGPLSAGDKLGLICRITEAVCSDESAGRRLIAMFPRPQPCSSPHL